MMKIINFQFLFLCLTITPALFAQTNYSNTTTGTIPDAACGVSALSRTFTVTGTGVVSDINLGLNITHTYRGDINATLISPQGTRVTLFASVTDSYDNYNILLDSDVSGALHNNVNDNTAATLYGRSVAPTNSFNAFDGQSAAGTWTLELCDYWAQDIGTFNSAQLSVTTITGSGATCDNFAVIALNYNANNFTRYSGTNGGYLNTISGTGVLSAPNAALQLPTGDILISNGSANNIVKYNPFTGSSLGVFATPGLSFPEQIKFAADGNLFVASQSNNKVFKLNYTTGATMATFTDANLVAPNGIGVIGNNLYVSQNTNGGKINQYNATTGVFVSTLYDYATGNSPRGIAIGPDGNLYVNVVYSGGARVEKFTIPANTRSTFATLDANSAPYAGILWGPDGKLYIADYGESEVHRYNSDGTLDITFTTGMNGPHYIAFTGCTPLNANVTVANPTCSTNNGSIDLQPTGGIAPYTYQWSNGATTQDISNLAPGTYTVTLTDANSVIILSSTVLTYDNRNCCPPISQPSATQTLCVGANGANLTVATDRISTNGIRWVRFTSDQSATNGAETATELQNIYAGTILSTVTATGTSNPYTATYAWNSADFPNTSNTPIHYYVYAILNPDIGASCRPVQEIKITVQPTPQFVLHKPSICPGDAETAQISNLTGAIRTTSTMQIDAGSFSSIPLIINGLSVGTHSITVKNAEGCTASQSISIQAAQPSICLPVVASKN